MWTSITISVPRQRDDHEAFAARATAFRIATATMRPVG
jgi:hypothetical protein